MSKISSYKTIEENAEGFFKDRGSKFYAFAYHVETEEEVDEYRADLKKQYHDARHHVYAFRIGENAELTRSSDDGEPSNSSGPPVLGQLKSENLTNILVVVVRYFGGTKLGIPGLINAYKTATKDALSKAKIITKHIRTKVKITYDYPFTNTMMSFVHSENINILEQNFGVNCEMITALPLNKTNAILNKLDNLKGINYEVLGEIYI